VDQLWIAFSVYTSARDGQWMTALTAAVAMLGPGHGRLMRDVSAHSGLIATRKGVIKLNLRATPGSINARLRPVQNSGNIAPK